MSGLTIAQHSRLDRINDEDAEARVVGLERNADNEGPVVRFGDGRLRVVSPTGRLLVRD